MLASMRFFLRFIGLDSKFDNHGFNQKVSNGMVLGFDILPIYSGEQPSRSMKNRRGVSFPSEHKEVSSYNQI